MLDVMTDPDLILSLAFVFNILGGCGSGIILPSSMAIVGCYKERREEFIGYIELTAGIGALCGPLLGGCFHLLFGYMGPFMGIGCIFGMCVLYFFNKTNSMITS